MQLDKRSYDTGLRHKVAGINASTLRNYKLRGITAPLGLDREDTQRKVSFFDLCMYRVFGQLLDLNIEPRAAAEFAAKIAGEFPKIDEGAWSGFAFLYKNKHADLGWSLHIVNKQTRSGGTKEFDPIDHVMVLNEAAIVVNLGEAMRVVNVELRALLADDEAAA